MNITLIKCRKCGSDIEQDGLKTLCPECRHESHMGSLKVDNVKVINTVKRNPCATLQQVADKYGITRERVRQIVSLAHVTRIGRRRKHYICLYCGKQIAGSGKSFCNRQCQYEYSHPMVECDTCQKIFRIQAYRLTVIQTKTNKQRERVFCSNKCRGIYNGLHYGFHVHPENVSSPHERKWDYAKVHELRDKGLSYSQITSELGIPGGTISTILNPRKSKPSVIR